ncbi:hypothetical protein Kpho02_01600 [Kitasatospora phosalacinea]|uniref:Uncharacterized protein n=2 Tax=Kitasatospora phosalacinea TaxID=2065 RepID=A0A9W6UXN8_9ACTN|nr:hypothetical protein Kpho02_01600 [Kitasatospora phosalacinea]
MATTRHAGPIPGIMSDDLLEPLGLGPLESALHLRVPAAPRSASARPAESVDAAPSALRTALHRLVPPDW